MHRFRVNSADEPFKVGFVSTRFAGNDGVSLESAKWAEALWDDGVISHWYAGLLDRDPSISRCIPEAHFSHSGNQWLNSKIWGVSQRDPAISRRIQQTAQYLKRTLYEFVDEFQIDLLIPQNVLTIPMHLPLGVAITEFLIETGMPTIAHHHDFYWERQRFSINAVQDYIEMAFPPRGANIRHVVINQAAQEQLALRKGASSLLVPNVFHFESEPPGIDDYAKDLRADIGLSDSDILVLQPTRIVPRKGIEHAIKLVGMIGDERVKLVISHAAGDEGYEYKHMLEEMAREEGVDLRFICDRISEFRKLDQQGQKVYTLWDVYAQADLVTYPSAYEGFGNALLEAIYFRVPVILNRYSIYGQDIEPKGFRFPTMDGFVTWQLAHEVTKILQNENYRREIVDHNYHIASRFYGYSALRRSLRTLITSLVGID